MRKNGDFVDSKTGDLILIGAVALVFGPMILRSIMDKITGTVSQITNAVETGAANTINAPITAIANTVGNPTYINGPSHADLVAAFGIDCASAIEAGGNGGPNFLGTAYYCPWGWQDKLKAMSAAAGGTAVHGLDGKTRDLKRGNDGVWR